MIHIWLSCICTYQYVLFGLLCIVFREWLSGVVRTMPQATWQTRKAALACLAAVMEMHSDLAYILLDILENTVGKVSV